MLTLRFIHNYRFGCLAWLKGDTIEYDPWNHLYKNIDEPTRVKNGMFVFCGGHGIFFCLWLNKDVEVIKEEL